MDTGNLIVYIKTEEIYKEITKDVETRFDTSNYEYDRLLPNGKNKKVIALMKHKLGGKIMKELTTLRATTYSYLTDNNNEDKKAKSTKKCAVK